MTGTISDDVMIKDLLSLAKGIRSVGCRLTLLSLLANVAPGYIRLLGVITVHEAE